MTRRAPMRRIQVTGQNCEYLPIRLEETTLTIGDGQKPGVVFRFDSPESRERFCDRLIAVLAVDANDPGYIQMLKELLFG